MAKNCAPRTRRTYIPRAEARAAQQEPDGFLVNVLRKVNEKLEGGLRPRGGFDARAEAKIRRQLEQFVPMGYDQLLQYLEKRNVISAIKNPDGSRSFEVNFGSGRGKDRLEELGYTMSAVKTYMEATGNGLQQLAENFVLKVQGGASALDEGLQFVRQLKHVGDVGAVILDFDQQVGRALRVQRRDWGERFMGEQSGDLSRVFSQSGDDGDALAVMDAQRSRFEDLVQMLGDPRAKDQAFNELYEIARRMQYATNPLEAFRVSSTLRTAGDIWKEIWYNGLLSAPRTAVTNLWSATYAVSRPIAQYVPAVTMQQLAKVFGLSELEATSAKVAAEAAARLGAMRMATADAALLGWKAMLTERDIYGRSELALERRAITGDNIRDAVAVSRSQGGALGRLAGNRDIPQAWLQTIDQMGKFVRIPSRVMLGSDTFIKHLTIRGEVAAEATRKAMDAGVMPSNRGAYEAFLQQEMKRAFYMDADQDMMRKWRLDPRWEGAAAAREQGLQSTFQQFNPRAAAFDRLLERAPIFRPFMPFTKTPLNIIETGIEATGIPAALKGIGIVIGNSTNPAAMKMALVQELMKDPARSYEVAGQVAFMSTIAAVVYGMVQDGQMEAGGPGRWSPGGKYSQAQRIWQMDQQARGAIPYGIKLPGGGYVDVAQLLGEPFGIWARMVADASYFSSHMEEKEQNELMAAVAMMGVGGLLNATFLTGLNDLLATVTSGVDGMGKVSTAMQNWASTQTPFGGFLNYVKNVTEDPYRRIYWNDNLGETLNIVEDTLGQSLLGKIASRLPGVSQAPIMVDQVYGQPVPMLPGQGRYGLNFLQQAIPLLPRGGREGDPAWRALWQIREGYVEAKPDLDKFATDKERQQYNRFMGTATVGGRTYAQAILAFHSRADVQEWLKDKRKFKTGASTALEQEFDKIKKQYADQAELKMRMTSPSYAMRAQMLEGIKEAEKANNEQAITQIQQRLQQLKREQELQ